MNFKRKIISIVPDFGTSVNDQFVADLVKSIDDAFYSLIKNDETSKKCSVSIVELLPESVTDLTQCQGNTVVVLGKKAMYAGKVAGTKNVFFINPEYDQSDICDKDLRRTQSNYTHCADNVFVSKAMADGTLIRRWQSRPRKVGVFTYPEVYDANFEAFDKRYPGKALLEADTEEIGRRIMDMANHSKHLYIEAIKMTLYEFPRPDDAEVDMICTFKMPVATTQGQVVSVEYDPSVEAYLDQSGNVKMRSLENGLMSLNAFSAADLKALYEAVNARREELLKEGVKPFARPHILLICDYRCGAENKDFGDLLQMHCGDVTMFYADGDIATSRAGVEEVCLNHKFDLVLTVGAGCLLAAGVTNAHRVFIDPEWRVCKGIKPQKSRYLSMGWFTIGGIKRNLNCDHMDWFDDAFFPAKIGVDTHEGMMRLCDEINVMMAEVL